MNRILWPLGILLLVGSVLGAGWIWQHNGGGDAENASDEPLNEIDSLAIADVPDGVADLYPRQMGQVVWLAETSDKDKNGVVQQRKFRKGEALLRLDSKMAELQLGKAKVALNDAQLAL